ncbi:MAG: UDP-3-O-acyl-N-acetylglucosamine deacetylase [Rhodobacteraceae bacterium]|nr:UDP-3-O-acyl-N-acetylglucosamine deacetylase [Paracoccaceae bacterium]
MQNTLKSTVVFKGNGLHSGRPSCMVVYPASAEHGIWFRRTDIGLGDAMIPAMWDAAEHTNLCTRLANTSGVSVSTVEHAMAALAGCGIHNALIEINGPEVPILDGSSAPFVRAFVKCGLRRLAAPVRALQVVKPVTVQKGEASATLHPADGLKIDFTIDFSDPAIGVQSMSLDLANGAFARELCDSRTFCRISDIKVMRTQGLALGGTLENAVVIDGDAILSPGGLRHKNEAVRHKMLDVLGDLTLAGGPLLGHYIGHKAGHTLTNRLLWALFETPGAVRMITCSPEMAARLPGAGLVPDEVPQAA